MEKTKAGKLETAKKAVAKYSGVPSKTFMLEG